MTKEISFKNTKRKAKIIKLNFKATKEAKKPKQNASITITYDEIKEAVIDKIVKDITENSSFEIDIEDAIVQAVLNEINKNKKIKEYIKSKLIDEKFIGEAISRAIVEYIKDLLEYGDVDD